MKKIAFFEVKAWEANFLSKSLKDYKNHFYPTPLDSSLLQEIKDVEILSTFIYSLINKTVLAKLPKLKLIVTRSTGFDHLDIGECQKRKIQVTNIPYYGENTVAEHTFALILSLSRNIHKSYVRTTQNNFSIEGLEGFDLKNKTLGVVGAGHIGLHVIRVAKAFGMKVLATDSNQDNFLAEVLGFHYIPFEELLAKSDIISLHLPYSPETHHLLNKKAFNQIKKGAILINTSRGGIIDTDALINALDEKILAGAGLDVLEGEELIKEEKQLLHQKNQNQALAKIAKDHILL